MSNDSQAEQALKLHRQLGGKIGTELKWPVKTPADLALTYTPGVGAVSSYLEAHPEEARDYTMKGNTVAVISDGSAVLGLGNIGPEAALPVMEGKALLFKQLAGVDAVPLVLATQETEEIIAVVKAVAPTFGGINLEDISSPRCFEIERRLQAELDIPVMHDDQHATAIVVLAGLLNAAKVVHKTLPTMRVVIVGAGAAGYAVTHLLKAAGVGELIVVDHYGIVSCDISGLSDHKCELANMTNSQRLHGSVSVAMKGADAVIGLSKPGAFTAADVRLMAEQPIVFALANPVAEIMPEQAKAAGAAVVATGRSDFPNQINNVLVFPGVFRGALDHRVKKVTMEMKLQAAQALASLVENPSTEEIMPSVFDPRVVPAVAQAIKTS